MVVGLTERVTVGAGLAVTVIVTDCVTDPAALVAVRVYVVVWVGVTTWEVPVTGPIPEIFKLMALVTDQARVDDPPEVMEAGVALKEEMTGGRMTWLLTVTLMIDEVAVLPAASRAVAEILWEPLDVIVVSQAMVYGEVVSSDPRLTPSSLNWTPKTPTLSEALALMVVVAETVEPLVGAVMETVGGVVSATVKLKLLGEPVRRVDLVESLRSMP